MASARPVETRRRPAPPDRRAARRRAHSRVSTRRATPSQTTGGARMKPSCGHHLAQLVGAGRLEAQVQLQLQRPHDGLGEGPRLEPPRGRRPGARPAARPGAARRRRAATRRSIPGRSTFTATSRPPTSRARCACASDAPATASVELGEQRLERPPERGGHLGPGRARWETAASRSFSRDRSSAKSAPKMSARVERNWPSLIATGPSRSSAAASRSPGRPSRASGPAKRRRDARQRPRARRAAAGRARAASGRRRGSGSRPRPPAARRTPGRTCRLRSPSPGAGPRRRRLKLVTDTREKPAAPISLASAVWSGKRRMLSTR